MSALRELLDRHGNPSGKINTAPDRREDDHERHQQHGQQVAIFNRRLQKGQILVLLVGLGDLHGALGNAFGHIVIDHDHAANAFVPAVQRHAAPDHVGLA